MIDEARPINTRPRSVAFIGWLFIIVGVFGFVYHATEFKAQSPADDDLPWVLLVRLLAIVGGLFVLRGNNWARWLLLAWITYHAILSGFHSTSELAMHGGLVAVVAYALFRPTMTAYFRNAKPKEQEIRTYNDKPGQGTDPAGHTVIDVLSEILINRPIDLVAEYAANPDNAPEWYVNIESAEWKTPQPLRPGSQVAFVARFLGRTLAYTYECTELVPGQRLVMRTSEGPFPMETTYTWTAVDRQRTKMTLRNRGNPTGFSKLFSPFMAAMVRRANARDLKAIKAILEQG